MKQLVTGGSGFLGVSLTTALLQAGHEARVFDLTRGPGLPPQTEFAPGDVRDRQALLSAARGCAVVHHLVGLMPQSRAPDELMQAVNVEGTRNALEAAVAAGARRFVFLSSMEVYGYPKAAPFAETCPLRPIGTYGRNKVEAEELCRRYFLEKGLETVSLRPSTLVAPGIVEPTFLDLLGMIGRPPPLFPLPAGGRIRFQMTALADCVSACLLAAAKPGIAGEAFNIGARDTVSLREQVAQVMERAGVKPPRFLPIPGVLARHGLLLAYRLGLSKLEPDHVRLLDTDMVMDCRKAEAMLGWRSERTNVDMILETYEWYRTRGGTKK